MIGSGTSLLHLLTLCRFTLGCVLYPMSFDPMSFDPMSFDPMSFYPMSFYPMSFYPMAFDLRSVNYVKSLDITLLVPLKPSKMYCKNYINDNLDFLGIKTESPSKITNG